MNDTKDDKQKAAEVAITNYMDKKGISSRSTADDTARGCGCLDVCDCAGGGDFTTGAGVGGATLGGWS